MPRSESHEEPTQIIGVDGLQHKINNTADHRKEPTNHEKLIALAKVASIVAIIFSVFCIGFIIWVMAQS